MISKKQQNLHRAKNVKLTNAGVSRFPRSARMSTGKRLAKRSILGTRVVAPGDDGLFCPGIIAAVKTEAEGSPVSSRYAIRFDLTRKVREYPGSDILGPGFAGLSGIKLRPGQVVYVTYCNREMQGSVVCHRPNIDQVIILLLVRLYPEKKSGKMFPDFFTFYFY